MPGRPGRRPRCHLRELLVLTGPQDAAAHDGYSSTCHELGSSGPNTFNPKWVSLCPFSTRGN